MKRLRHGAGGSLYLKRVADWSGLYVQLKLEDTEAFKELAEASQPTEAGPRSPVLKALTTHPKERLAAARLGVQVYICVAFIISYGTIQGLNIARSDMRRRAHQHLFAIRQTSFLVHGQIATDVGASTSWARFSPDQSL